jgi:hypothetical protein
MLSIRPRKGLFPRNSVCTSIEPLAVTRGGPLPLGDIAPRSSRLESFYLQSGRESSGGFSARPDIYRSYRDNAPRIARQQIATGNVDMVQVLADYYAEVPGSVWSLQCPAHRMRRSPAHWRYAARPEPQRPRVIARRASVERSRWFTGGRSRWASAALRCVRSWGRYGSAKAGYAGLTRCLCSRLASGGPTRTRTWNQGIRVIREFLPGADYLFARSLRWEGAGRSSL